MDDKIKGKFYFVKAQAVYGKKDFKNPSLILKSKNIL